jgi:hypothetical protein
MGGKTGFVSIADVIAELIPLLGRPIEDCCLAFGALAAGSGVTCFGCGCTPSGGERRIPVALLERSPEPQEALAAEAEDVRPLDHGLGRCARLATVLDGRHEWDRCSDPGGDVSLREMLLPPLDSNHFPERLWPHLIRHVEQDRPFRGVVKA